MDWEDHLNWILESELGAIFLESKDFDGKLRPANAQPFNHDRVSRLQIFSNNDLTVD